MLLNYNHVFYFHVVAEEGSIVRASDRLGVSQPTISEQLRQLERSLGIQLFSRSRAGLSLTDPGRRAFEHTSAMFRAGERLVEALAQENVRPVVSLRVGISASVSRTLTAEFLMPVLALENCTPTIRGGDALELLQALRSGDLDLVLSEMEPVGPPRPGVASTVLHRTQLVAVANKTVAAADNWENVVLINYRAASPYRWEVDAYLDASGLEPRLAAECDDTLFMLEAAIRGGFVAFVPRVIARAAVAEGKLNVIATLSAGAGAVHAVYDDGETAEMARRAVRLLVDYSRITSEGAE